MISTKLDNARESSPHHINVDMARVNNESHSQLDSIKSHDLVSCWDECAVLDRGLAGGRKGY